jgi:hypothetical protein
MRDGETLWVVELKVRTQGQGQYYRHAIGQVALYRAFIRGARALQPWFRGHALDPLGCQAALAFPVVRGAVAERLMASLKDIADAFAVTLIELPDGD